MFRALCAHHQEVKFVLYSIWYYTEIHGQQITKICDAKQAKQAKHAHQ